MGPGRDAEGRLLGAVAVLLLSSIASGAAAGSIAHRLAPRRAETLIAAPGGRPHVVVTGEGGLRFADGATLHVAPVKPFAFSRKQRPSQSLAGGRLPVVLTRRESEALAMEGTAFVAASPPMACLHLTLRNKTDAAIAPVLRFEAGKAHGELPGKHVGFERDGQVFALLDLRAGQGQMVGAGRPKRSIFRREGGRPLPGWGKPKQPCDSGFRHIVAGFSEPATYHLKAEKGTRYLLAVGLCESHWKEAGKRICDLRIEGKKVATVDPVAKPHGTNVPFVLTFPATDRDGDGWITVASVANPKSPDENSIVNVLWLFEERVGKGLSEADILAGKANREAHCYVNCGGPKDAPGPATLDYRVQLPAKDSATLWLKMPFKPMPARKLAAQDSAKLLHATGQQWRETLGRAATVTLSEGAAADLLYASVANLLMLRDRAPGAAASAALALDRMDLHAQAAERLDALVAELGDDRLWHDGEDAWCATGRALQALAAHHELTGDRAWLEAAYPAMLGAAEALIAACDRTKWSAHKLRWQPHGLLPAAPYRSLPADHWLVHDFWAVAGIRAAAQAARALEKPNDYKWLEDDLAAYQDVLRRCLAESRVLGRPADCLPAAPGETDTWTFAPCLTAIHPASSDAVTAKQVNATFSYLDQHGIEHLPGGLDGRSPAVDLPLACQYALARLARGDAEAALAAFTTIANCAAPTGSFPERLDLKTRKGAGDMPSAAAAAGYVLLLRDMLVREEGETLHLLPCVPRSWLAEGLTVERLPTAFGPLSITAKLDARGHTLLVEPQLKLRRKPKSLIIHPPVTGKAKPLEVQDWAEGKRIELNLKEDN